MDSDMLEGFPKLIYTFEKCESPSGAVFCPARSRATRQLLASGERERSFQIWRARARTAFHLAFFSQQKRVQRMHGIK